MDYREPPSKPNGTLSFEGESFPVFWDLMDDSVYWCDIGEYCHNNMRKMKEHGWVFKPLPSEAVKDTTLQQNTPFKWPSYWTYAADEVGVQDSEYAPDGDAVKHPNHYNQDGEIECIDAIKAALGLKGFAAYCRGNTLKYLWRFEYKGGIEDLNKARQYLDWLVETEEEIKCSSQ